MLAVAEPEELPVAAARAGDARAWDALFQRYQLPLYAYVHELVRHEQTALDVVQESFIAAARHIGTLADDVRFGSWLFSIAHQKVVQHWRRRGREAALFESIGDAAVEFAAAADDPGQWLLRKEQEECFHEILAKLPPPQRAVVLLHFLEDFPLADIAGITGAPLGTVKSRLHHAKRALRRLLEEQT